MKVGNAFGLGAAIFLLSLGVKLGVAQALGDSGASWILSYFQLVVMACLCIVAARWWAPSVWWFLGLVKPAERAFWQWISPGILIGFIAVLVINASPARGLAELMGSNILAAFFMLWVLSPMIEELLCRGLLFGVIDDHGGVQVGGAYLTYRNIAAAILFASMHLVLLLKGTDLTTVAIIVPFTFVLGLSCGAAREMYQSLWPAIVRHAGFNVGSMLAGISWVMMTKLVQ